LDSELFTPDPERNRTAGRLFKHIITSCIGSQRRKYNHVKNKFCKKIIQIFLSKRSDPVSDSDPIENMFRIHKTLNFFQKNLRFTVRALKCTEKSQNLKITTITEITRKYSCETPVFIRSRKLTLMRIWMRHCSACPSIVCKSGRGKN
jgi:hypothetical protein